MKRRLAAALLIITLPLGMAACHGMKSRKVTPSTPASAATASAEFYMPTSIAVVRAACRSHGRKRHLGTEVSPNGNTGQTTDTKRGHRPIQIAT